MKRKRIAFDLDETLGVPIIDNTGIIGFQIRQYALQLLDELKLKYDLILWSVSNRNYIDKVLSYGLKDYFLETYSWNEIPSKWKDIRKINIDYLIDDTIYHKDCAIQESIENHYIIIPAYGSKEDNNNPLLWIDTILDSLGRVSNP